MWQYWTCMEGGREGGRLENNDDSFWMLMYDVREGWETSLSVGVAMPEVKQILQLASPLINFMVYCSF